MILRVKRYSSIYIMIDDQIGLINIEKIYLGMVA